MAKELEKTIKFTAEKDYSEFEKLVSGTMADKMKTRLSGFINHIEKGMFDTEKEE